MAPDLSEKLLGIDIDDADGSRRPDGSETDNIQEELEQFVVFGLGAYRFAIPVETVRTLAEVPDELTRVPRAPSAIEGMVDLRGEITAVIDPRVHFPDIEREATAGRERLLVLDRPSDQQSAAIHVEDVFGVDTVLESEIFDETTVEESRLSGDALDHPLVVALFETEREPDDVAESRGSATATDAERDAAADSSALSATQGAVPGGTEDAVGNPFALESEESGATTDADDGDPNRTADARSARETVVEGTPVVDVETLLLASGQRE